MTKRPTNRRRRPKGDKRARTRARLIEAAAAVIGEKGWDQTSLDEVARRTGMTRGAVPRRRAGPLETCRAPAHSGHDVSSAHARRWEGGRRSGAGAPRAGAWGAVLHALRADTRGAPSAPRDTQCRDLQAN